MAKEQAKKKAKAGASKLYKVSGNKLERNNKSCPKCGPGIFMAKHTSRWTCGQCHMTEFIASK